MQIAIPWTALGIALALGGPLAIAMAGERIPQRDGRLASLLLLQAALAALVGLVGLIARTAESADLASVGLARAGLGSLLWGAALAAFFVFVYGPFVYRLLSRWPGQGFEQGLSRLQTLPTWYLVLAIGIGGMAEEFLYRAYVFDRIAAYSGSLWVGAVIPLLLFAWAHVPLWGWGPAAATAVSGGILTALYAWRHDLVANVIAHCLTDLVGIVGPLLGSRARPPAPGR